MNFAFLPIAVVASGRVGSGRVGLVCGGDCLGRRGGKSHHKVPGLGVNFKILPQTKIENFQFFNFFSNKSRCYTMI